MFKQADTFVSAQEQPEIFYDFIRHLQRKSRWKISMQNLISSDGC